MKRLIYILLSIIMFSCGEKKVQLENIETENLTEIQIDSILTDFNFNYNNPIFIDSTNQVLLPITTQFQKVEKMSRYSSYKGDSYPRYWNILFYNSATGETNLLTESKMRISDFRTNMVDVGKTLSKSVLYQLKMTDYNNDNKLTYKDPQYLFISKINGKDLRQISPENEDLETYTIIPNTDQIIIKTKRDSNKDLEFGVDDELVWYKVDVNKNSKPIEIINMAERKKIKHLYFEQWLKKK